MAWKFVMFPVLRRKDSVLFSQTMSNSDRLICSFCPISSTSKSRYLCHSTVYFRYLRVLPFYWSSFDLLPTTCCTAGFREGGRCRQRRSCLGDLSTVAAFECHRGVFESDQETWPKFGKNASRCPKIWYSKMMVKFFVGDGKATESLAAKGS